MNLNEKWRLVKMKKSNRKQLLNLVNNMSKNIRTNKKLIPFFLKE